MPIEGKMTPIGSRSRLGSVYRLGLEDDDFIDAHRKAHDALAKEKTSEATLLPRLFTSIIMRAKVEFTLARQLSRSRTN
jgi:hypothetical protein